MEKYKDLYDQAVKKLKDLNKKIKEFQKTQQDWEIQFKQQQGWQREQFKRQQGWQHEQSKLQLELNSQLQKISENNKKLQQVSQDLEDKEKESNTLLDKIRNFYEGEESDEITEDGKKKRVGGMKDKITALAKKSEALVENQTRETLAGIFKNQANKHKKRSKFAAVWFYIAVILLVVAIGYFINALLFTKLTIELSIYSLYPLFSIAAFAFGYFLFRLNKTISEETRLFTEYTHKHSLAKAYTGYKEEVKGDEELKQKLLSDLTGAIAKNPVRLLSKDKSKANTPIEAISDSMKKNMNSTQNNK